jgi:hypothetical protein
MAISPTTRVPTVGLFREPWSPAAERFWSKVRTDDKGCWVWSAAKFENGYGAFWLGRQWRAHRISFLEAGGVIGAGEVIDHLCRNKACVRPAHLRSVSPRQNSMDAGVSAINARKTHCPRGHAYSGVNSEGRRICHQCAADWMRRHRRSA